MGLHHVLITLVTRDNLPDGGASQLALTIQAIHNRLPGETVEVLVPDFGGSLSALTLWLPPNLTCSITTLRPSSDCWTW
jgi:lipoyl synthase